MDLPMLAFKINGTSEYIELYIDEVFGFPNELSYGGGYGARGRITIVAGNYNVKSTHYFTTGELYVFSQQLIECYQNVKGTCVLKNTEYELEMQCEFDKLGHVKISGKFQKYQHVNNILLFEIGTDQTQIKEVIEQLEKVIKYFGDNNGIIKEVRKERKQNKGD